MTARGVLRAAAGLMLAGMAWGLTGGLATAQATCATAGIATGGTITQVTQGSTTYCVHSFSTVGTSTFTLTQPREVEHLIVGGGGGGGATTGGGGGGGGMLTGSGARAADSYDITVGAGGAGDNRTNFANSPTPVRGGANGGDSVAFGITALGGGGGGTYNAGLGIAGGSGWAGGSGGGASLPSPVGTGTSGQGTNGGTGTTSGFTGGGGGGAGQPGFNGTTTQAGRGGDGLASSITGVAVTYAGGGAGGADPRAIGTTQPNVGGAGGGGASSHGIVSGSGTAGLGGGGAGGRSANDGDPSTGGNGGSGVVILRYVANTPPLANAGADVTVSAGATVTLSGATSTDPEANITSYAWTRITGTSGTLSNANDAQASFATVAPAGTAETFVFRLTVTDAFGATSTDDVAVTVNAIETPGQPAAGGGNSVYDILDPGTQRTFRIHVFETAGTFTLDRMRAVDYLIVGGGGGGGAIGGGGGGAGGMLTGTTSQPGATPFQIVVGAGGAGDTRVTWPNTVVPGGADGGVSSAFGIVASGGGGGGTYNTASNVGLGRAGGSGGGASVGGPGGQGTAGQGNTGGTGTGGGGDTSGGGGGGAGQVGANGSATLAGRGGDGVSSSITGSPVFYAGGGAGGGDIRENRAEPNVGGAGGGGASSDAAVAGAGTPGLGGGGAGGRAVDSGVQSTGGNGGSGVVILRYVVNAPPVANAGPDANAFAGLEFTLDGSATTDPDGATATGNIITYQWDQTGGTAVTLTDAAMAQARFTPVQPASGTTETLTFRLTVTDAFGAVVTDDVTITLQGMADLTAAKTARVFSEDGTDCADLAASAPTAPVNPAAIPGACIEYTISVENTGPVAATAITLTDVLPSQLTYVAAERTNWAASTLDVSGNTVTISEGTINSGQTATLIIRATVN